jgi:hypothetical protein
MVSRIASGVAKVCACSCSRCPRRPLRPLSSGYVDGSQCTAAKLLATTAAASTRASPAGLAATCRGRQRERRSRHGSFTLRSWVGATSPKADQSGLRGSIRDARHELSRKNNGAATLCSRMEWVRPDDPWLGPLADWAYFRGCGNLCCVGVPPSPVVAPLPRPLESMAPDHQEPISGLPSGSGAALASARPQGAAGRSFPQARGNHPSMVSDR